MVGAAVRGRSYINMESPMSAPGAVISLISTGAGVIPKNLGGVVGEGVVSDVVACPLAWAGAAVRGSSKADRIVGAMVYVLSLIHI